MGQTNFPIMPLKGAIPDAQGFVSLCMAAVVKKLWL